MTNPAAETRAFKAEVQKLLHIITHSLYTNREIFLRELVSNASDALDKLRFAQSKGEAIREPDLPLEIRISVDKEGKTITVEDTGVGMTHDELVDNLGTIARSGSEAFLKQLAEQKDEAASPDAIIGRFGVGFYSVFMIADKVTVAARSAFGDAPATQWTSDGLGEYELAPLPDADAPARGARIRIHVKEDAADFLDAGRLSSIIKRHSNFVSFPVLVEGEKVNTIPAIWREPKFQVAKEQYKEFYEFLTYDSEEPLETIHAAVDAPVQFTTLLFIPRAGQDWLLGFNRDRYGLDLYVKRVLIQKENKDLLPEYLGFVKGVADTEDLPLNLSRETLQENALIRKMAATITKQVLSSLEKMAKDRAEDYETFWRAHGRLFRQGYSDYVNRDRVAGLLRFNSSVHEDANGLASLEEYLQRKKTDQQAVYFLSAPSREAAQLNPHVEIFRRKGLEALYLYDPLEEICLDALGKFQDMPLVSVERADLAQIEQLPDADGAAPKAPELSPEESKDMEGFLAAIKSRLGDRVTAVKASERLSSSPCCLSSPEGGVSSHMERLLRLANKDVTPPAKVFEINRDHPLVRNLLNIHRVDPGDEYLGMAVEQLFESALLTEGYLRDPHRMVERLHKLLEQSSGWRLDIQRTT